MAFGGLKGTFSVAQNSITAVTSATGSVAVVANDLVYAVIGEQVGNTSTGCTDNLGNTYSPVGAGTLSGAICSGRAFRSIITVPGVITSINIAGTASSNNVAIDAVVIEGPFQNIITAPANITSDVTSPFTCPATGVLPSDKQVVIGWGVANHNAVWSATAPNLLGIQIASQTQVKATIGYQVVGTTASVSPIFTAGANPAAAILGTTAISGVPGSTAAAAGTGGAVGLSRILAGRGGVATTLGIANAASEFAAAGFAPVAGPLGSFILGDMPLGSIAEKLIETTEEADGAALGAGAGVAVGTGIIRLPAASIGLGVATATARAILHRAAIASGTGGTTAIGRGIGRVPGSAAGAGATTATIRAFSRSSAACTGLGIAVASSKVGSRANSIGQGASLATGRAVLRVTANTLALGIATATIRSINRRAGTTTGIGAASAASRVTIRRSGIAAAAGAANGIMTATPPGQTAPGVAAGQGVTVATGRATVRQAGSTVGLGAASGAVRSLRRVPGTAGGVGATIATSRVFKRSPALSLGQGVAAAGSQKIVRVAGTAAGLGGAASTSKVGARGNAIGGGATNATGRAIHRRAAVAIAIGAGVAAIRSRAITAGIADGDGFAFASSIAGSNAFATGLGLATAHIRALARRSAVSAGIGLASATGKGAGLRRAAAAGAGGAVGIGRTLTRAVGHAAGQGVASTIWRTPPYVIGRCVEADHLVSRLDVAIARKQQTIKLQRMRTDPATGEIFIAEEIIIPAQYRDNIPQDLEAGEVQDIRVIISPRWLASFGLPERDDRVVANDNPTNIERIDPLYHCGECVRVNLFCRG